MKLMTLNTHSLVESSYEEKKEKFIEMLAAEQPDVIALQEQFQDIGHSFACYLVIVQRHVIMTF